MKTLLPTFWLLLGSAAFSASGPIDFNRDIRPILSDNCFFCHGPDSHERKAGLRLDTWEGATKDLGGYAAIEPGDAEGSEFWFRIISDDPDELMPPENSHKALEPGEIALLKQWIAEGAEYSEPWAYTPPKKHPEPTVKDSAWPKNWVDQFVLARLEAEGLNPSPDADRVTLIRRLHFDLTGLPPSTEAVAKFVGVEGDVEAAWSAMVDDLLASPYFGERLAMYWLDLVRFADTVGYHGDQDHSISPYRDWVIAALNANVPFDQFTREQLAGDLLPNPSTAQKVASGYNRLLQTSHEGGIQKKEYNAIYAADRVRNVSAVWMGATVGCAQCHDHKYDPYTIKDHYAMAAFFADLGDDGFSGNALPTLRPPEILVFTPEQESQLKQIDVQLAKVADADLRSKLEKLTKERDAHTAAQAKAKTEKQNADVVAKLAATDQAISKLAPKETIQEWQRLRSERKKLEAMGQRTMVSQAKPPRVMRILPRGNWQDETGEIVQPAVPEFLGHIEKPNDERATRLDLANWLTDSDQGAGGLTARVFANRFWYLFFGSGISRSLEDFGGQGEPPANLELLDRLALEFTESGWDMKSLIRTLVTSRAYRQSSIESPELRERDPYNQLVARQSRYRLPAELVRDNALAISGLLVQELGGPSVKPYQPVGYFRHLNFPTRKYAAHQDERQWRRGVYVHWQRMFLHPMMKAMDAPSREECTAQRTRSNTPNAALVLLNDPTFVEAARAFAARILSEGGKTTESRIDFAWNLALSRLPDAEEKQLLANLLSATRLDYESQPEVVADLAKTGISPIPPNLDPTELATWTAVARAILNLSETITRN